MVIAAPLLAFHGYACAQLLGSNLVVTLSPLEQKLRESGFELHAGRGKFTGNAAPVLEKAIAEAKFVLIGEDHLTGEIPEFTERCLRSNGPRGIVRHGGRNRTRGSEVRCIDIRQTGSSRAYGCCAAPISR